MDSRQNWIKKRNPSNGEAGRAAGGGREVLAAPHPQAALPPGRGGGRRPGSGIGRNSQEEARRCPSIHPALGSSFWDRQAGHRRKGKGALCLEHIPLTSHSWPQITRCSMKTNTRKERACFINIRNNTE
jgi:hypothetical protein